MYGEHCERSSDNTVQSIYSHLAIEQSNPSTQIQEDGQGPIAASVKKDISNDETFSNLKNLNPLITYNFWGARSCSSRLSEPRATMLV